MLIMRISKNGVYFIIVLSLMTFCACTNNNQKKIELKQQAIKMLEAKKTSKTLITTIINTKQQQDQAYNSFIDSFSLEEKIAQLFIQSIGGNKNYIPEETLSNGKPLIPGAYIFFGFNIASSPEELINFTYSINEYCVQNNYIQPILSIDHEGGIVNRLRRINAPLPSCKEIAQNYTKEEAQLIYELQALQLKNLGFHMNIAPVVEILSLDNADFLEDRSFGNESQVLEYSKECVSAYEKNNVLTVIKHFPGNTNTDPHTGLPIINLSKEEVFNNLSPFKSLILEDDVSCVLMSHAIVNCVDKDIPSCLSKKWVTDILRNEFGFNGLIVSDDIFMAALSKNGFDTKKAVIMAINAGVDSIMITQKNINYPVSVLLEEAQKNDEFLQKINQSFKRIINYKLKKGLLEYTKDDMGNLIITSVKNQSINQSLIEFNRAKEQNITLYNKAHSK